MLSQRIYEINEAIWLPDGTIRETSLKYRRFHRTLTLLATARHPMLTHVHEANENRLSQILKDNAMIEYMNHHEKIKLYHDFKAEFPIAMLELINSSLGRDADERDTMTNELLNEIEYSFTSFPHQLPYPILRATNIPTITIDKSTDEQSDESTAINIDRPRGSSTPSQSPDSTLYSPASPTQTPEAEDEAFAPIVAINQTSEDEGRYKREDSSAVRRTSKRRRIVTQIKI